MERTDFAAWYDENQFRYQDLTRKVENLLVELLESKKIPFHSVSGRLKSKSSYLDKCSNKAYSAPEEIMDVAGLRVITHTTAEVKQVCALIEETFAIDEKNSGDKAKEMGVDKVGYLSVHYIAKFNAGRLEFAEYKRFDGMCFEIQVRSLLQHAWAEIEHDRSYKFAGVLPDEIKRKFHLVAGTLELMDQEFCALSNEIDSYAKMVTEKTEKGDLDIPIDSTSVLQYLNKIFEGHDLEYLERYFSVKDDFIKELSDFGIKNLQGLDQLIRQKTVDDWISADTNYVEILRMSMIMKDAKKYFESAWHSHWTSISLSSVRKWEKLGVNFEKLSQYVSLKEDDSGGFMVSALNSN